MTLITGQILDSGRIPIASGILKVRLDAPVVDATTAPDSILAQIAREFPIVNGAIGTIDLLESQSRQITYEFSLYQTSEGEEFYFPEGTQYFGPRFLHTNGKYYTGLSFRAESKELDRILVPQRTLIDNFHAIVPSLPSVEFASLIPQRLASDTLPLAIRQVADILVGNPTYRNQLRGGPRAAGAYNPSTFYKLDEMVELGGSSYVYINSEISAGNAPPNSAYWQLVAARGSTGTGTTGNDTPYDPVGWDGQIDAPSRNALRDIIQSLARSTDLQGLAPILNPILIDPTRASAPAIPSSDNSARLAPTNWIRGLFAPLESPQLTGTPSAPTPATNDDSQKLATTAFVANYAAMQAGGILAWCVRSVNLPLTAGSWSIVTWDTEIHDPSNIIEAVTRIAPPVNPIYRIRPARVWVKFTIEANSAIGTVFVRVVDPFGNSRGTIASAHSTGLEVSIDAWFDMFLGGSNSFSCSFEVFVPSGVSTPRISTSSNIFSASLIVQELPLAF
jgi:hypothetical protein